MAHRFGPRRWTRLDFPPRSGLGSDWARLGLFEICLSVDQRCGTPVTGHYGGNCPLSCSKVLQNIMGSWQEWDMSFNLLWEIRYRLGWEGWEGGRRPSGLNQRRYTQPSEGTECCIPIVFFEENVDISTPSCRCSTPAPGSNVQAGYMNSGEDHSSFFVLPSLEPSIWVS